MELRFPVIAHSERRNGAVGPDFGARAAVITAIDVEVFTLDRPVIANGVFETTANRITGISAIAARSVRGRDTAKREVAQITSVLGMCIGQTAGSIKEQLAG